MPFFNKSVDLGTLPLDVLDAARAVFRAKNWPIDDPFNDEDSFFEKFAAMLSRLSADERDLVLTLTEDFLHCVLQEESNAIRATLRAIDPVLLRAASMVIAVPLVKPSDIGKIKSGSFANYLFRAEFASVSSRLGVPFNAYDRAELLSCQHGSRRGALVMLVDDFIGSGQTAEAAVNAYRTALSAPSDELLVVSFVAQRHAVEHLSALGVRTAVGVVRGRGITDSVRITDKATASVRMRQLSARLGIRQPLHQLGHNGAEALVAMRRCPNNTFPCYWTTRVVDGAPWPAPFKK